MPAGIECVKALLSSSPVLAAPDFDQPFKLKVDASAKRVGSVLLQDDATYHTSLVSTSLNETLALLAALQNVGGVHGFQRNA